ncbi:MAG: adaptor protein MecA, partial [Blautia sp.]
KPPFFLFGDDPERIGCDNMKIEKISDTQSAVPSPETDSHQIRISELAYGTDKAKKLFRDMMQQAQIEFGFEADNIPLMIEAIPVSAESAHPIITKVEDPEELDTRFSKFSPYKKAKPDAVHFDGADNIIDIFQKLCEESKKVLSDKQDTKEAQTKESSDSDTPQTQVSLIRLYTFHTLDDAVIAAAHGLDGFFKGRNTLYKDEKGLYQLILHQSSCSAEDFNKICNILSEMVPAVLPHWLQSLTTGNTAN